MQSVSPQRMPQSAAGVVSDGPVLVELPRAIDRIQNNTEQKMGEKVSDFPKGKGKLVLLSNVRL